MTSPKTPPKAKGAVARVSRKLQTGVAVPPDPDGMNDERSNWAHNALESFARETHMSMNLDKPEVVSDFLTDLMHWCDRNEIDMESKLRHARQNYLAEIAPDIPS